MAQGPVYVLGGYQTDFARNLAREDRGIAELVAEAVDGALQATSVEAGDVGRVHVGNAFGELFTGQAQLGAMPATVRRSLWGIGASRHEAACASGGVAVLSAMAEIEAGWCECALVVGAEQERNVPGDVAARHLGAAAWVGREGQEARFMWPHMFSLIADEIDRRWGLDSAHLAAIAQKNLTAARRNPLAQTRRHSYPDDVFGQGWHSDEKNPPVEGRLRRLDCGQITDGAAAVLLASAGYAERWARARGRSLSSLARVEGHGHRTATLSLADKLSDSAGAPYLLPHLREAICDAYRRAGVEGPSQLDGAEVHDCFTVTEYVAIDHLGLTAPGQAGRAIDEGVTAPGGRFVINASGGLIGLGHPVGATGVRMVLDAARQVTGQAGACQIDGARRLVTLNIGGSCTTVVAFVIGRES